MPNEHTTKITILVGPKIWTDQKIGEFKTGALFFDAQSVGATLAGLRAVVDEFYRSTSRHIVVTMPHGESDVKRVGFALRQSVKQTVAWMDETMSVVCPVAPWRPIPKEIETKRMILTHPSPEQIDRYFDEIIGTDIFDTILWEGPADSSEMRDFWLMAGQRLVLDEYPPLQCAMIEKRSGVCIGGCGLRTVGQGHDRLDVGYAVASAYHGQGYATEAVGALVDYGFERLGAQRISGEIFVGNQASARVLSKLGFVNEGTHYGSVKKRGKWIDAWIFGLTRESWSTRAGSSP